MNYFYNLLATILLAGGLSAQESIEYKGAAANEILFGANHIRLGKTFNVPDFVQYARGQKTSPWEAVNLLNKFTKSNQSGFVLYKQESDHIGWEHFRFRQMWGKYPMDESQVIVHTRNGLVESVNGEYFSGINCSLTPNLSEVHALNAALSFMGAEKYMWEDAANEAFLKQEQTDPSASFYPKGELVIKAERNNLKQGYFHLCYKFNIYAELPLMRRNVYVDATTGEIVDDQELIHTGTVPGTAKTKYSGTQTILVDSMNNGLYRLRETSRGKGVETYNLKTSTNFSNTDFIDSNNVWENVNAEEDEIATDAHWGAEITYDYFKNSFGRRSYDNNDAKLLSYVHYSANYDNASWDGSRMRYGDGNQFKPLVSVDIAGHEMAHGVTGNSSNLVYNGESGALNESFSDIFGTCIEFNNKGSKANYRIGEEITTSGNGLRNMANPNQMGDPGAYGDADWYTGAADNGGVHTNSGVQNHWFYLLSKGEKATNFKGNSYDVKGLGIDTAGQIAYRNDAFYLTRNSKYIDARFYAIKAAKDLYGICSEVVKHTTNAWYAVNVGGAFDTMMKADLIANPTMYCSPSDQVKLFNNSSMAASYSWDFGDGQTSTSENPTHVYGKFGNFTIKLKIVGCLGGSDSMTKVAYVQVDSGLSYCKSIIVPRTGTGNVQTACTGTLLDNGGLNNYFDGSDGNITLSPTNASYIKLTFSSFNMENPGDYLYVYDGTTTAAKLIGRYTGNSLPNGGTLVTSGSSVTIRQQSDAGLNFSGFQMDWQCYLKIPDDAGVVEMRNRNGRMNTSLALGSSQNINVLVKNFGSNTISNVPVKYQINGGSVVSETITQTINSGDTLLYTFNTKADLSSQGYYSIDSWVKYPNDTVNTQNNVIYGFELKQIKNDPIALPYYQDFENDGQFSTQLEMIGVDSTDEYDFNTSKPGYGRMRVGTTGFARSGSKAITLDQSPNSTTWPINYLYLTLNMDNYKNNKIFLDFSFASHGDESNNNDRVWARASENNNWVEVYNTFSNAVQGAYKDVTAIDISGKLATAGQTTLSKSFQLRFGQENNGEANPPPSTQGDGLSFDDIRIWKEDPDVGVVQILSPVSNCGLGNAETVKVQVMNFGSPMNNVTVPVSFKLDNGSVVSQNFTFTLQPNATQDLTFATTADLSTLGNHVMDAWTSWSLDVDGSNDSLTEQVISKPAMSPVSITPAGPLDFCQGDSVQLTATAGFTTYTWSNNKTGASMYAKSGMNYTCKVTNADGCNQTSKPVLLTMKPKPLAGFNWSAPNGNPMVSFFNFSSQAISYIWDFGDGDTSSLTSPKHTYKTPGSYRVLLKAINGCGSDTVSYKFSVNFNVGIASVGAGLLLFPNPATDILYVQGLESPATCKLFDISGKTVYLQVQKQGSFTLPIHNLAAGVYILEVGGNHYRVVKE